ncbi:MAG: hypothetical protein AABY53_10110 [Bdellovibrionota bacterium]
MKIFLFYFLFFSFKTFGAELYQQGMQTRCLAMGGTCASHVRGSSVLFFNPAALARVEGFDITIAQVGAGASKDFYDLSSQFQGSTFTLADVNKLYGKTLASEVTGRSAFVTPNFGFGLFSNSYVNMQFSDPTFPTFNMSLINDYGYIFGGSFSMGSNSSFGATVRHIKRQGGVKDINISTLAGLSVSGLIDNNFNSHGVGHAIDIAAMTTLNHSLKPTLSLVWHDVGVTTYNLTTGTTSPPDQYDNLIFGASVQQEVGIMSFTHAFEYKFIRTLGFDLSKKIHLGTELSVGLFDLRAGVNQGYVTYGAAVDLWLFEVDAAVYATEQGTYGGQDRNDRYSVSLTFSMDFDQSFKMQDREGRKRRLKQRR